MLSLTHNKHTLYDCHTQIFGWAMNHSCCNDQISIDQWDTRSRIFKEIIGISERVIEI